MIEKSTFDGDSRVEQPECGRFAHVAIERQRRLPLVAIPERLPTAPHS
jgi:hypothetical protein